MEENLGTSPDNDGMVPHNSIHRRRGALQTGLPWATELTLMIMVNAYAGALLSDLGRAILGFLASTVAASTIFYISAILQSLIGPDHVGKASFPPDLWIAILVRAFIPFPVIGLLVASIIGAALGERYL